MQWARWMAALVVAGTASCGGGGEALDSAKPGTDGCDFRGGSLNGKEARCQERTMVAVQWFAVACALSGGESTAGPCPRETVLAGCLLKESNPMQVATDWYYPTTSDGVVAERDTRDKVAKQCEKDGTLVDP